MTEPETRRKFVLVDPTGNHNKEWLMETWLNGDCIKLKTSWGRVGQSYQTNEKEVSHKELARLIREKEAKGYHELDLAKPKAAGATIQTSDPKVEQLVQWIYQEAGESIASYLAVPVDALSSAQITKGRQKLYEIQTTQHNGSGSWLTDAVTDFYRAIPTKMPRKIDAAEMVRAFLNRMVDIESELDQLEAAVSTLVAPGGTQYNALGATISLLSSGVSS